MCENNEKTVQLEGYTHKQCEHGFCYQHNPDWSILKFETVPGTKQDVWRWFKKNLKRDIYHSGSFIVGLLMSIDR